MNDIITVKGNDYTKEEFGRTISFFRRERKWSQPELAKRVFNPMNANEDRGFSEEAGGMRISRIESGKIRPSDEYAEALFYVFGINDESRKLMLSDQRLEQIVEELASIVGAIPPKSAESLLTIARMIRAGDLNQLF